MQTTFSPLELQLIKSRIETHTSAEIAEVLETTPENVFAEIVKLIGADEAQSREEMLQTQRAKENEEKSREEQIKRERKISSQQREQRSRDKEQRRNHAEKRFVEKQRADVLRHYKTRAQDYSKMRCVRIDRKTLVFLKPEDNEAEVVARYQQLVKQRN